MATEAETTEIYEIQIPTGVGAEMIDGTPHLVGTASDLWALVVAISAAAPAPVHLAPIAPRYVLVVPCPTEPTADDGPADVVEAQRRAAMTNNRPVVPDEDDRGPCGLLGCRQSGPHVHKRWDTARATGNLTGQLAHAWGITTWAEFLKVHGISSLEAIATIREHDHRAGLEPLPSGLRSIDGRPDLAQVLIDLANERRDAARAAGEPF